MTCADADCPHCKHGPPPASRLDDDYEMIVETVAGDRRYVLRWRGERLGWSLHLSDMERLRRDHEVARRGIRTEAMRNGWRAKIAGFASPTPDGPEVVLALGDAPWAETLCTGKDLVALLDERDDYRKALEKARDGVMAMRVRDAIDDVLKRYK